MKNLFSFFFLLLVATVMQGNSNTNFNEILYSTVTKHALENPTAGEVKVLFVYTTRAALQAGGPAELKKQVDNGMRLLNEGLRNSNIGYTAVAIPQFVEVASEDQPNNRDETEALLDELRKKDGKYNKVHQFRQQKKGDIVCLIYSGHSMGMADSFRGSIKSGEYMVCHYKTFGSTYVFPHEFGHNLGAQHAPNRSYNFQIGNNRYRTISNNGGVSVPYFSENRSVQHKFSNGETHTIKLGDANYDNAKIMRQVAPLAAKLSDKLTPVSSASGAYSAKLVDPASAPMPSGSKEFTQINNLSVKNGCLIISYTTKDIGRFTFTVKDKDGNPININGGYDPSLKPGEDNKEICAQFETGDQIELTIDDTKKINYVAGQPFKGDNSNTNSTTTSNNTTTKPTNTTTSKPTTSNPTKTKPTPKQPMSIGHVLAPGQSLTPDKKLVSANGKYYTIMDANGNIVTYNAETNQKRGETKINGNGSGCSFDMQDDGHLILYDKNKRAIWASETHTSRNKVYGQKEYKPTKLILEANGSLVLYSATNRPIWSNDRGLYPLETKTDKSSVTNLPEIDPKTNWPIRPNSTKTISSDLVTSFTVNEQGHFKITHKHIDKYIPFAVYIFDKDGKWLRTTKDVLFVDRNPTEYVRNDAPKGAQRAGTEYFLYLDGKLIGYYKVGESNPTTAKTKNTLKAGESIKAGEKLISENGAYMLYLQEGDGNLCIYKNNNGKPGTFVWASMKYGFQNARLTLQSDGNLVIYDGGNRHQWSSETHPYFKAKFRDSRNKPVKLVLENDGKINLYNTSGQVVWSSK